jgi:hypothetical protein
MERSRDTRTILLVVAGLVVAVAGVATIGVHPHWSPDGQAANDAMLTGLGLATGAVCFTRYRSTGDTHPLFVCAGLLAVAGQTVLFDRHTFLSILNSPWEGLSFPALGWFAAWLVAAAAFVLARPWWDRRGRKPLRAPLVLSATTRPNPPSRRPPTVTVSPLGVTRESATAPSPEKSRRSRTFGPPAEVVVSPGTAGSIPVSRMPISTPRPSYVGCARRKRSTPVLPSGIHACA